MRLTDEQIAAIRDGTEGVTPGPWRRYSKSPHVARDTAQPDPHPNVGSVLVAECGNYQDKELVPFNMERWLADAAHIARCDPDTIRALATEVLESRAALALNTATHSRISADYTQTIRALEARVAELEGVAVDVMASLAAAISLLERGGRKAAASDKMFAQMLVDYNASLDRARAALGRNAT